MEFKEITALSTPYGKLLLLSMQAQQTSGDSAGASCARIFDAMLIMSVHIRNADGTCCIWSQHAFVTGEMKDVLVVLS